MIWFREHDWVSSTEGQCESSLNSSRSQVMVLNYPHETSEIFLPPAPTHSIPAMGNDRSGGERDFTITEAFFLYRFIMNNSLQLSFLLEHLTTISGQQIPPCSTQYINRTPSVLISVENITMNDKLADN